MKKPGAGAKPVLDLGHFHSKSGCQRVFLSGYGGNGVKVGCTTCGVVADVEAVGLAPRTVETLEAALGIDYTKYPKESLGERGVQ